MRSGGALPAAASKTGDASPAKLSSKTHAMRGIEEKPVPVLRLNHVTVDAVSVAETVVSLSQRLPSMGSLSFRALTQSLGSRIEIIVHFLALLELCKLGLVDLGQGSTFGDVRIVWIDEGSELEIGRVDVYEG